MMNKARPLDRLNWAAWELEVRTRGVTIDRPSGSRHPVHAEIVYPIDYGFVNGTLASDGEEIDIFVGTASNALVGAIWTTDFRKQDRECKLIWNCSPGEIYLVNGFINFDRSLMSGQLALRYPMASLWDDSHERQGRDNSRAT